MTIDDQELKQMADFTSIALNQLEKENNDTAKGFVEDVYESLQDEIDDRGLN